ncbi:MAG: hypothetical protein V4543_06375 [Bacteroidota bacterium]
MRRNIKPKFETGAFVRFKTGGYKMEVIRKVIDVLGWKYTCTYTGSLHGEESGHFDERILTAWLKAPGKPVKLVNGLPIQGFLPDYNPKDLVRLDGGTELMIVEFAYPTEQGWKYLCKFEDRGSRHCMQNELVPV